MKVALFQTETVPFDRQNNLARAERFIMSVEADLVVLPEMFATGYCADAAAVAEPADGATVRWLKDTAVRSGRAVMGTVAVKERGRCYNRMYFAMPDGNLFAYDKRHLFGFGGEDKEFSAGDERIIVGYMGCRILPLVCYDLRFPAWSYMPAEADLIVYSASWAASRIEAWDILLPARAVENQAYVIGVNRVGNDSDGTLFNGHSAAYDFMGRKIADCGEVQGSAVVAVSPNEAAAFREKFRAWQDSDKIRFEK